MAKKEITCRSCPYYTGIQCHGHGEFWGECTIYNDKKEVLKAIFQKDGYWLKEKDCWANVRSDNSKCNLFILDNFEKK